MSLVLRFPIFVFICFLVYLPQGGYGQLTTGCLHKVPLIEAMQKITCAHDDLRTAVQRGNLLKKVSEANYFQSLNPKDVVRSTEALSVFNRDLTDRIEETHARYQERGVKRYTLSIASFPANVKNGSCSRQKTIDFQSPTEEGGGEKKSLLNLFADDDEEEGEGEGEGETKSLLVGLFADDDEEEEIKKPVADYIPVAGKEPRSFHVRKYQGEMVMCEQTTKSYKERLDTFCGLEKKNCDWEEENKESDYCACKKSLTPSCGALDKKGAKKPGLTNCVSGEQFAQLSETLLLRNTALEWKYCPGDCSYYTQTVQAFYRNKQGQYCSDSYLIVHCGPKKASSQYNLNIREINDLCRDFESCTYI